MKDAIVEEVQEIRRQIEQEFNHDVAKYLDHVYEVQKEHGGKLVRRQPTLVTQRKPV